MTRVPRPGPLALAQADELAAQMGPQLSGVLDGLKVALRMFADECHEVGILVHWSIDIAGRRQESGRSPEGISDST